jgi:hypothetical protein
MSAMIPDVVWQAFITIPDNCDDGDLTGNAD